MSLLLVYMSNCYMKFAKKKYLITPENSNNTRGNNSTRGNSAK